LSTIIDIADAVVAALNAAPEGAFGEAFSTAERAYRPVFDLAELKGLRVTVVPRGVEMGLAGRGLFASDVQIDVAVQQKLSTGDNAEIDALMGVVERIAEFIRSTGRFGDAAWVRTENVPIYSPEHLAEQRAFTGVLTLTLRVMR